MGKLVTPKVYLVGYTVPEWDGLRAYLQDAGALEFIDSVRAALAQGVSPAEALVSLYAKLCYKSLVVGQNLNIARVRDIHDNLIACHEQGHGSVFEHVSINFVASDVSRVFTHELVRHRVGTAFSQTSGRYVRGDEVDIVFDPVLEPVRDDVLELQALIEARYRRMVEKMGLDGMRDFGRKKKITSALRRLLPDGQSNEIGFTVNLRALRHLVQVRTSQGAEWEIRAVFAEVYRLVKARFPLVFHGAKEEEVDGCLEVTGMKTQPY